MNRRSTPGYATHKDRDLRRMVHSWTEGRELAKTSKDPKNVWKAGLFKETLRQKITDKTTVQDEAYPWPIIVGMCGGSQEVFDVEFQNVKIQIPEFRIPKIKILQVLSFGFQNFGIWMLTLCNLTYVQELAKKSLDNGEILQVKNEFYPQRGPQFMYKFLKITGSWAGGGEGALASQVASS